MTQYPESGIKLVADVKDYTSAMDYAIFQAEYFDSLGDISISVSADTSDATSALEDLPLNDETVNYTVEVDQTGDDVTDLPLSDENVNYTVNVDETGDDISNIPKDGETIDTTVAVQTDDTSKETLSAVQTLKNLKIVETVWNIAGTAVDIVGKFASFSVTPMLNLEDAVARVNAQTANGIPDAERLISGIFYDDLGDSIDQVANLVTQAYALKLPIDDAVRSALTFTHTFSDQNPEQVLKTIDAMLKSNIAPDATTAGDMLVTAFQQGENKGQDLLTAIQSNANAIQSMGLTGPESLSFIKTGLDNGFTSAQDVLGALEKIKQNVTNAAGNATSDVTKTLNLLGIANPAETGEKWSAEFFAKVIDGIKNQPGLSDTEKEVLFTNLIGGKQGGKTFAAFMKMSPTDAASIFENVQGAADTAATEIDNSLSGAIDDFTLAAQKAAEDFLSSEQIDLPGKIAALKTGLQDGLNALQSGGTLSDALTIALKPIGLDETFQGLESAMGNFIIGILQAVAMLQASPLLGNDPTGAAGTQRTIKNMATTQLAYDLKIANPDQVAADIATATSRGLSSDEIAGTVSKTIDELIKTGTADSMAQAQTLIDTLKKPIDQNTLPTLASGAPMNVLPTVTPEALDAMQAKLDASKPVTVNAVPSADSTDAFLNNLMPISQETETLTNNSTAAVPALADQSSKTDAVATSATDTAAPLQAQADTTKKVTTAASASKTPLANAATEMDAISGSAALAATNLSAMDMAIKQIITTAGQLATANDKAAQTGGTGTTGTGGTTPASTTTTPASTSGGSFGLSGGAILSALQHYIPGGSFSKVSSNTNIINNTNYVQSESQADALGYRTGEQIRGMA